VADVKAEKSKGAASSAAVKVGDAAADVSEFPDDSGCDYRCAFLDADSGEVYEGGWLPRLMKRHGLGICLYADGRIYEGLWSMGREHGRGQLLTGDRQPVYVGEWLDGQMHGHGTYNFPNGDRYSGEMPPMVGPDFLSSY
jgi:hypothetical protein